MIINHGGRDSIAALQVQNNNIEILTNYVTSKITGKESLVSKVENHFVVDKIHFV